jgi:hypothetical protein
MCKGSISPLLLLSFANLVAQSLSDQPTSTRVVYQFPNSTFIENLAVRHNGHILLDTFSNGSIYSLDPASHSPKAELVAQLPGVGALVGIAEIAHDVFAVGGGALLPEGFGFVKGSMKVFKVDMKERAVNIVADLPDTVGLNAISALPGSPGVVLGADSKAGRILRIDTTTGRVDAVITDTLLAPSPDPNIVPIGVNGIKIRGDHLYFTNSGLGFFGRIKITARGERDGQIERIAGIENPSFTHAYDDFDMDKGSRPNAYVTLHSNAVQKIAADGTQTLLVGGGDSELLNGPTSVAVSRDGRKIYISTAGGQVVEVVISHC